MDESIKIGRWNASPESGEEIVITGMAGKLPNADNIRDFQENLYNKVSMMDDDTRRWQHYHPQIPKMAGKLYNIDKFDAGFFGIQQHQSNIMDPMVRLLLERTFEAICDAGCSLEELKGSKTGVFIGVCVSDTEKKWVEDGIVRRSFAITSCLRAMLAIRVSYFFQFEGPSIVFDTACSSSINALEHAYRVMREGKCDNAIIGGTNLCLQPLATLDFSKLGVLSPNEGCKSFDDAADGYTRAEAICVLFMQKAKNAKRILGKVVHTKCNVDGFKPLGITYPSGEVQKELLSELYEECNLLPADVAFVEAHATGTRIGDFEEVNAIGSIFCKDRDGPLHIGSVKSSIGHAEPASGLCSIIKVLIGMENNSIPPNIRYNTPRKDIDYLVSGRIKVVTEAMPWPKNKAIVGVNSFGFGGTNAHVVLKWNEVTKESKTLPDDDLPRLICVSGRTPEATECILNDLAGRKFDEEFINLIQEVFKGNVPNHIYRSYSVLSKPGELLRETRYFVDENKRFMYTFADNIEDAFDVVQELKQIPIVSRILDNVNNIYEAKLNSENSQLWTIILQVIIIEILKKIQLRDVYYQGCGLFALSCAYFDNVLNLKQTLLWAQYLLENNFSLDNKIKNTQAIATDKWINVERDITAKYFLKEYQNPHAVNACKDDLALLFSSVKKGSAVFDMLNALGRVYLNGGHFKISELFPPIAYPVSRGTPMISPLIKWDHNRSWYVTKSQTTIKSPFYRMIKIDPNDEYWSFINGHVIDGRNLFPATGYLFLAWITLASIKTKIYTQMKIVFNNVKFVRATPIRDNEVVQFCLMISKSDGYFEICDNGAIVVSGYMHEGAQKQQVINLPESIDNSGGIVLKEQDIYKELKLRGYDYKGHFKGIKEMKGSFAKLHWQNNWVAFMDCMLQTKLLQEVARNLYLPTGIDYMIIDAKEFTEKLEDTSIEIQLHEGLDIIKTDFIEVRGLRLIPIPRKKNHLAPCLESYRFIPNCGDTLTLPEIIRVNVQIIHENHDTASFKVCSISDGEEPMLETLINEALNDIVIVKPDIKTLTPEELKEDVEKCLKLKEKDLNILVTGKYLLHSKHELYATEKLSDYGFILSYENVDVIIPDDFYIITNYMLNDKRLLLLKKREDSYKDYTLHELIMDEGWVAMLQNALKENPKTVVYTRNPMIGVMGLMNCIRRERNTKLVRCFIFDKTAPYNFDDQLKKLLMFNVYKDGCWGTYRRLPLSLTEKIFVDHAYLKVVAPGDFSSLQWMQGNLCMDREPDSECRMVKVYCSAINFKDIMLTSGRLSFFNRLERHRLQGMEFAGKDNKGNRVMGVLSCGALASIVQSDKHLLWNIPDEWSMEDAATVPIVYSTVLYALTYVGNYKQNPSILIHCGSGGVGQAAINIALSYGYTVFTTVGSQEKMDFIRKQFPQIKRSRISYSRDTSFEQMIYKETNGHGVNIVLNSLSDEKMAASIRCLAKGGKFLEIGKYDVVINNSLQMELCQKQATFHGIMPDIFLTKNSKLKPLIFKLVNEALKKGRVIPLRKNIFKMNEIEHAFRFMASGKHIGKVVVSMRDEYKDAKLFQAVPQYICDSNGVYIIIGGLGGFGLELADWLICRGATKLILTTRNGIQTAYQHCRIQIWRESGAQIILSREDCSTKQSCYNILFGAKEYGDVAGIFNVAVVIKDEIFENMTEEDFVISFKPKYLATKYLDAKSRVLCPKLKDFVVFSSVSCGFGNAGQSNYGMSNSFMERICEARKAEGLPGLAIEWGVVGDVGLVAQMQKEQIVIAGTVPQPIASCLDVMDVLMKQDYPIVSSMVVAEKRKAIEGNPIVASILQILGLRDLSKVSMSATLPELGMDSIMSVEIHQRLEMDYEIYLSPRDLRNLTLQRLLNFEKSTDTDIVIRHSEIKLETLMSMIYKQIVDEKIGKLSYTRLSGNCAKDRETIFLFPGIEGTIFGYEEIAKNIDGPIVSFHYSIIKESISSIQDIANDLLPMVESEITNGRFKIISYSFGASVAMELVAVLEAKGYNGILAIIEGSADMMPKYFQEILSGYWPVFFDTNVISSEESFAMMMDKFTFSNFSAKVKIEDYLQENKTHSEEYLLDLLYGVYKKIKIAFSYKPAFDKLKCKSKLFKANIGLIDGLSADYDLSKYFEQKLAISKYDGNHYSILTNKLMIKDLCHFTRDKL